MKLKKIVTIVLVCFFALSSIAFAAKGGAKFSAPKSAPSVSTPSKTSGATTTTPSKEYTPSKDAKSLSKDAPAASTKSAAAAPAAASSSPWGGMMRNVGLFAGGMFLGSMLGNMFGMGGMGMGADIMGLLMNVVLLGAVFMVGRFLWNKFKNKGNNVSNFTRQQQDVSPYRNKYDMASKKNDEELPNITPGQNSYQSKSKADEYRNR